MELYNPDTDPITGKIRYRNIMSDERKKQKKLYDKNYRAKRSITGTGKECNIKTKR